MEHIVTEQGHVRERIQVSQDRTCEPIGSKHKEDGRRQALHHSDSAKNSIDYEHVINFH